MLEFSNFLNTIKYVKKFVFVSAILIIPFFVFAQDAGKKKAYLFYLDACPHCHNVDKYFTDSGIYDKYEIKKLDAKNPFNGNLLMNFYKAVGEQNGGGVPVVAFGNTMMVGDKPVIDNFVAEIEKADASAWPDPEKEKISLFGAENQTGGGQESEGETKNSDENSFPKAGSGNKSRMSWVIIGAIIVLGASGLVWANRKKSNKEGQEI